MHLPDELNSGEEERVGCIWRGVVNPLKSLKISLEIVNFSSEYFKPVQKTILINKTHGFTEFSAIFTPRMNNLSIFCQVSFNNKLMASDPAKALVLCMSLLPILLCS